MHRRLLLLVALLPSLVYCQSPELVRARDVSRAALREMMQKGNVPGVSVAVYRDGEQVWAEGLGVSNLERRTAVSIDTLFGLGSITKSLTTALLGRLVDRGLVDLDAPVETYLPDFPHRGKGVTPRLIAAHLSGLSDEFSGARWLTLEHYATTDEALKGIYTEKLAREPGSTHLYGTGTYTLLAGVVEKVTAMSFVDAMKRYVLDPLGLSDTIPNNVKSRIPRRGDFFLADDKGVLSSVRFDPSHKMAGAGYLSTASDVARFASALLKPGFLSESTLSGLFADAKTSGGGSTGFGLGWRIGKAAGPGMTWVIGPDEADHDIVHQPGGGPGISSWVVMLRTEELVVVILSNLTGAAVGGKAMDTVIDAFRPVGRAQKLMHETRRLRKAPSFA